MFWETVSAIFLLAASFPIWLLAAFVWGLVKFALSFIGLTIALIAEQSFDVSQIWTIPLIAVTEGLSSAWSVPVGIWDWAKFERPWWAAVIGLVCLGFWRR